MNKPILLTIGLVAVLAAILILQDKKFTGETGKKKKEEVTKIALVVKNIGNPFFDAVNKGWQEACNELKVEGLFRGPENPTAEGQIEIMESLIAQKVDGITYVANDPKSLINVSKKAMKRGIPIVGWESGIVAGSRNVATEPVAATKIGADQVKMIAEMIGYEGDIAILSAAATMDNQNTWIKYMKEELKKEDYAKMKLVTIVYGDDVREKSYNEALSLFKAYPNLKGIISPTSVGLAATAKAITDENKIGKIHLTGLGLPSELAEYVNNGACKAFGLWNPIDLGYVNAYVTYHLANKTITGKAGETFKAGRLGEITIINQEGVDYGLIYMGSLFRFDKSNIEEFKKIF